MAKGLSRDKCLKIAQLTKHQFYHRPSIPGRRGRKPSTDVKRVIDIQTENISSQNNGTTCTVLRIVDVKKETVANKLLEDQMLSIDQHPDLKCGAVRMTQKLQLMGFEVNHKKVASMMKRLGISGKNKRKSKNRNKNYVQYRVLNPTQPLTHLQMDIKSHWLIHERRNAYTLTVIDTFTREVLGHYTGCSVLATDVQELWEKIIEQHLEPEGRAWSEIKLVIISDNGPQFIAEILKDFFARNSIEQEFTHPYTPEENGYIESFHATMSGCVEREHFNLESLKGRLTVFYKNYNMNRTHTSTKGLPPDMYRRAWENDLVITCYDKKKAVKIKLRHNLYEIPGILSQKEHLAKKNRAKRTDLKEKSGEMTSSAYNVGTPVNTSSSVASCAANEVKKIVLN
jgi:putative transposase